MPSFPPTHNTVHFPRLKLALRAPLATDRQHHNRALLVLVGFLLFALYVCSHLRMLAVLRVL